MPTYEIYKKDGTPIKVEGPEGATTRQLLDLYVKRQLQPSTSAVEEGQDDALDRVIQGLQEAQRQKPGTLLDIPEELLKGIPRGVAGILESGALGAASVLPEIIEDPVRRGIKSIGGGIQDFLAPDPNVGYGATDIPAKFGEALGSFGGILGTAAINPGAAVALATTAGAGEASERAREADATAKQRTGAAILGAGVGL